MMSPQPASDRSPEGSRSADTDLGKALKDARLARGYSLAQVAAATGISKSLLSLIENNKSDVTLRRLVMLAEHYETHIADLVPAKSPPDPVVTRRKERRRLHSGKTPIVLDQGDSAYYDSSRRHRWSNLGDRVARVISVATPPTSL